MFMLISRDYDDQRKKKKKNKKFTSFGQPTRLLTYANHGNNVICKKKKRDLTCLGQSS